MFLVLLSLPVLSFFICITIIIRASLCYARPPWEVYAHYGQEDDISRFPDSASPGRLIHMQEIWTGKGILLPYTLSMLDFLCT
jgi:hypothetical protein